jgi:hypothetical protein
MSKTAVCIHEAAAPQAPAALRRIERLRRMGLAKLTSFSYGFMSLDPSSLTTTMLGVVCHTCAAALARWRSDRPARRHGIAAFD